MKEMRRDATICKDLKGRWLSVDLRVVEKVSHDQVSLENRDSINSGPVQQQKERR